MRRRVDATGDTDERIDEHCTCADRAEAERRVKMIIDIYIYT